MSIFFIGAGPGDPELLTLKGKALIEKADLIIYAGSLVNPEILKYAKDGAEVRDSAEMELGEIVSLMAGYARAGKSVARVHTGDPSLYGAIAEQMAELGKAGVGYEVVPGVSSAFAAAAALGCELTAPEVSQTVIFTRLEGRTPVPGREALSSLAAHRATMVIFLSVKEIGRVVSDLSAGYPKETPAAVVYKASWPEQKVIRGTLADIAGKVAAEEISKTALIFVGEALDKGAVKAYSKLYDKEFGHGFRQG